MTSAMSSTLDGLPKQFVAAMRTLFEIMDDKHTGFVNFADIEARWQDGGSKELPKGVLDALRKVTPPNGMLSFERFCAGLKICLLRNQVDKRNEVSAKPQDMKANGQVNRPPSAPLLDLVDNNNIINRDLANKPSWGVNNNTAAIRPNNIINPQQRSSSMTQLKDVQNEITFDKMEKHSSNTNNKDDKYNNPPLYGPPKPPRTALGLDKTQISDRAPLDRTSGLDRAPDFSRTGLGRVGVLDRLQSIDTDRPTGIDRAPDLGRNVLERVGVLDKIKPIDRPSGIERGPDLDRRNGLERVKVLDRVQSIDRDRPSGIDRAAELGRNGMDRVGPQQIDRTPLDRPHNNMLDRTTGMDRVQMERNHNGGVTGNLDRAEIRNALANWQMGLINNQENGKSVEKQRLTVSVSNGSNGTERQQAYSGGLLRTSRSLGDGKAQQELHSPRDIPPQNLQRDIPLQSPPQVQLQGIYQKKPNARRREPRRHTLQNGIDYNMLKRMKQIEQEKEVLMTGLTALEKAREWYLKQVAVVQEKMKYLGRMGHAETWSEAQQERLELQRARVLEVNRHLAALTESWERGGLPLHMNLAVHHYPAHHEMSDKHSERLKQQNRLLTEELNKKGDRISSLEREKASLIQMLQIRSPTNRSNIGNNSHNRPLNGHLSNGQEEAVF